MTRRSPASLALPALLAPLALLAGCDPGPSAPEPAPSGPASPFIPSFAAPGDPDLTPQERNALAGRNCRAVAEAYFGALERGAFHVAAAFWDDPVIDGARLEALFAPYVTPRVELIALDDDSDPDTCTAGGLLTDSSDARTAPVEGEIELVRVGTDPAEAGAASRAWTIRSSTLVEPMQRSRRGGEG